MDPSPQRSKDAGGEKKRLVLVKSRPSYTSKGNFRSVHSLSPAARECKFSCPQIDNGVVMAAGVEEGDRRLAVTFYQLFARWLIGKLRWTTPGLNWLLFVTDRCTCLWMFHDRLFDYVDRLFDYVDIITTYLIIELISKSHDYKKRCFVSSVFHFCVCVLSFFLGVVICEAWW